MTIHTHSGPRDPKKSWKESQRLSPVCDVDRICRILDVDTVDDYNGRMVHVDNGTYAAVYSEARAEALRDIWYDLDGSIAQDEWVPSEDDEKKADAIAEEKVMKAEQEDADEAVKRYSDAVLAVAERLFAEHGLTLVPMKSRRSHGWRITPEVSWMAALGKIVTTINGVGYFEFRDARELCDSGPWSPMMAVLHHVGWMKRWPEVYGERSIRSQIDARLR